MRDVKLQANPFFSSQSKLFGNVRRKNIKYDEKNWSFLTEINSSVIFLFGLFESSEYTKDDGLQRWVDRNHPRFERRTFRTLSARRMQGGM